MLFMIESEIYIFPTAFRCLLSVSIYWAIIGLTNATLMPFNQVQTTVWLIMFDNCFYGNKTSLWQAIRSDCLTSELLNCVTIKIINVEQS